MDDKGDDAEDEREARKARWRFQMSIKFEKTAVSDGRSRIGDGVSSEARIGVRKCAYTSSSPSTYAFSVSTNSSTTFFRFPSSTGLTDAAFDNRFFRDDSIDVDVRCPLLGNWLPSESTEARLTMDCRCNRPGEGAAGSDMRRNGRWGTCWTGDGGSDTGNRTGDGEDAIQGVTCLASHGTKYVI